MGLEIEEEVPVVMRRRVPLTLLAGALVCLVAVPGCGSKKKRRVDASTAAPTTSATPAPTTSSTPAPTTSSTPAPVATATTPPAQTKLTDALASSFLLREVVEVDAKVGTVKNRWSTGRGPVDVVNDGTMSYVANSLDQNITVIDRLANNTVTTIDVTATPITGLSLLSFVDPFLKPLVRPTGLAVTPSGRKLYSANLLNVTVIDTTTLQPTKSFLGLNQLSLSSLLSNPGTAVQNFLSAPVRGLGMAKVAATNEYAVATCMITGTVMRIDARTDTLAGYTDVGRAPVGVAIARNKAYVACALSQDVYVVDIRTGLVLSTLTAGMIPVDCAASQAEDRIYVANAISGEISIIDTAVDLVVGTLPAGLSIASIFQQLGVALPTSSQGGLQGALQGFLQGFATGMTSPTSFGSLITGGQSSGGLLSPANLINGLITGFLAFAGINQQQMSSLNLPGIGILSVSVAHDPDLVCSANAFMGQLLATEVPTGNVIGAPFMGLLGPGPVDVAAVWRK